MKGVFVNFNVPGKELAEVAEMFEPLVPAFSDLPGLKAKIWIADPDNNRYGAFYLWRDEESVQQFLGSELWKSVEDHPQLANHDVRVFDVIEQFTKATQPDLTIV